MLTPQEITEKGFVKAVFGGYDMEGVDEFLETVSSDYNSLYKENAILKGKLKVLVEKVEEYRSTEDAMRMALLTAQRMGEEITVEANKTKTEMLQSTEVEIKARLTDTAQRIADEEMRLAVAAKETAKFIELSQAIIRKHSEFLTKLEAARRAVKPKGEPAQAAPGAAKASRAAKQAQPAKAPPPPKPAPAKPAPPPTDEEIVIDDIAEQIGSVVESMTFDEESPQTPEDVQPQSLASEEPPSSLFEDDDGSVNLFDTDDETQEEITPRPKFDFDDLKFGANFDNDD